MRDAKNGLRRAITAAPIDHHPIEIERHMTPAARKRWAGQNAWDADNLAVISTKLGKNEAAEFRRLCRQYRRTSPYRVLGTLARLWIDAMQRAEIADERKEVTTDDQT